MLTDHWTLQTHPTCFPCWIESLPMQQRVGLLSALKTMCKSEEHPFETGNLLLDFDPSLSLRVTRKARSIFLLHLEANKRHDLQLVFGTSKKQIQIPIFGALRENHAIAKSEGSEDISIAARNRMNEGKKTWTRKC